tara:strand:+ start:482 stop:649 length:168 start_codon:yes stop_codon:yes gene_type:complete
MNNRTPKPIDEIFLALQTIHKKLDDLKKEINEIHVIIKETKDKENTASSRGWFFG